MLIASKRVRAKPLGLLTCLLGLIIALFAAHQSRAHAEIERSSPAENAVLAAPPRAIQLWTTEAVASGAGSPDIRVLDEEGNRLQVDNVRVDPADDRHIVAVLPGAGFGTFTVVWSMRSAVDGHTLSGTYAFRVGGTDRAPGAATVEGEDPRAWAVAARWAMFLGAAIAAAGFLIGPLIVGEDDAKDQTRRRRYRLALAGAVAGLIATVAEPLLQTRFPPTGLARPSLTEAIDALPAAWFLRAPGLLLAAIAAAWLLVAGRPRLDRVIQFAGATLCLAAIAGLALTSHASARESWRAVAIASVLIHQWAVALWVGGLAQLLVGRPYDHVADRPMPIQRFSFYALFLAAAGIATGVVNTGLILPRLEALWESDYGKVVIIKVAVLLPALALATFHRLALRRALERVASVFRLSLRLETALAVLVVLGGSTLAMLAPPSDARNGTFESVDLAAPLTADPAGPYVRFAIKPAESGENDLTVSLTDGTPRYFDQEGNFVDAPILHDVALVRVGLTSLLQAAAPYEVQLAGDGSGRFSATAVVIGLDGWWRADVLVRRLNDEDVTVTLYFMLPDPNIHGMEIDLPESQPDGEFLFQRGLTAMTGWSSVHFTERLAGGTGGVVVSDHTFHTGDEGAAMRLATKDSELIRAQGRQWRRDTGGDWRVDGAPPVQPPAEWGENFAGATGFRLGAVEQVGGRTAQIVTFVVPSEKFATAWYAWWVDLETGNLLRETMVSTGHYMVKEYDSFNAAPPIEIPPA